MAPFDGLGNCATLFNAANEADHFGTLDGINLAIAERRQCVQLHGIGDDPQRARRDASLPELNPFLIDAAKGPTLGLNALCLLLLPRFARVDALRHLFARIITPRTRILQANIRVSPERNPCLLSEPGETEVPALDAAGSDIKEEAERVGNGVCLIFRFCLPGSGVRKCH
ncbi:hypothetical protein D3C77_476000 [compost metagenome]